MIRANRVCCFTINNSFLSMESCFDLKTSMLTVITDCGITTLNNNTFRCIINKKKLRFCIHTNIADACGILVDGLHSSSNLGVIFFKTRIHSHCHCLYQLFVMSARRRSGTVETLLHHPPSPGQCQTVTTTTPHPFS